MVFLIFFLSKLKLMIAIEVTSQKAWIVLIRNSRKKHLQPLRCTGSPIPFNVKCW